VKEILNHIRAVMMRIRQLNKKQTNTRLPGHGSSLDKRLLLKLTGRHFPSFNQLKHLSKYLSEKEKTIIAFMVLIIFISLSVMGVYFIWSNIGEVPASGGTYVEASVGGPRFVNPILASTNDADLDIVKLVFSGLLKIDGKGELVPDLAESFTISEDGKIYTFQLKSEVTWHDGAPFTSADVAATINYIKDPTWKSPLNTQFKNVKIETPSERTVIFTLEEPFAPFLSLLTVGILPQHLWSEVLSENAARAELNLKPVGTGLFRFKNFTKNKSGAIFSYTLARYSEYYGEKPLLSEVTFTFYNDFNLATEALIDKKVDGLSFLPLEFREAVDKISSLRTYPFRLPQYTAIFFNQNHNQILKSKEIRQALALALDQEEIVKETLGYNGVPVHGPILPGFLGFHPDVKKYPPDSERAASLLNEAGWSLNDAGKRSKKITDANGGKVDTSLAITLTTVDAKENIAVAQIIKRHWENIGVQVELEMVPVSRVQQDILRPRAYDALLYGEILGADPDPFPFWHSSQNENGGLNLAAFSNRRVDELLEQARSATDREKRKSLYKEFQNILTEELPAIFLYSPTYTYAVDYRMRGIETGTIFTPADRFASIEKWYVKTKKIWKR
jgi:peptide/nickel transport system substrate-binding protein